MGLIGAKMQNMGLFAETKIGDLAMTAVACR